MASHMSRSLSYTKGFFLGGGLFTEPYLIRQLYITEEVQLPLSKNKKKDKIFLVLTSTIVQHKLLTSKHGVNIPGHFSLF